MSNTAKTIHIKTWDEFLRLATNLKPTSIAYTIQRAPLCKPPIGLRLIFASKNTQYVFLDFAKGNALKRTKIPVQTNKAGEAFIAEETIRNFLHVQLKRKDLNVYSLEVLGY
ncbi:MAG: hypothetical protein QXM22_02990 [Candidatus Bathyarchaeia archaeon]